MREIFDYETEHISSGDLIFNCGTQLLLQKGTSRTHPSCSHPFLWPMKSLSNQDTLALEFLMVADIKRPLLFMQCVLAFQMFFCNFFFRCVQS